MLLKKERLDHKPAPSAEVGSEIFFTSSQARSRVQDAKPPTRKSCKTIGTDCRFALLLPPPAPALLPPSLFFFLLLIFAFLPEQEQLGHFNFSFFKPAKQRRFVVVEMKTASFFFFNHMLKRRRFGLPKSKTTSFRFGLWQPETTSF